MNNQVEKQYSVSKILIAIWFSIMVIIWIWGSIPTHQTGRKQSLYAKPSIDLGCKTCETFYNISLNNRINYTLISTVWLIGTLYIFDRNCIKEFLSSPKNKFQAIKNEPLSKNAVFVLIATIISLILAVIAGYVNP